MHDPGEQHMNAVMRILRYLKGSLSKGILFKRNNHFSVEGYTDADWAGSIDDRRSTSGYFTFVGGNLVTWRSKKQNVVTRSSAKAEYRDSPFFWGFPFLSHDISLTLFIFSSSSTLTHLYSFSSSFAETHTHPHLYTCNHNKVTPLPSSLVILVRHWTSKIGEKYHENYLPALHSTITVHHSSLVNFDHFRPRSSENTKEGHCSFWKFPIRGRLATFQPFFRPTPISIGPPKGEAHCKDLRSSRGRFDPMSCSVSRHLFSIYTYI
ncbi:uncharacterized protein LOC126625495 [Malus sylvestris]|uniref:uncharacterized protein LOC126625495 n=1 Tax=Malus sylvestris TaxID=3752 RepID=UPI0021ACD88E|nr:uncharacterized protein LOC126625495 [Malus sylvestris]